MNVVCLPLKPLCCNSGRTCPHPPSLCSLIAKSRGSPGRHHVHQPKALPEQGEDISDAMKADLARYQATAKRQRPAEQEIEPPAATAGSSIKDAVDKLLIADFFLVLFILAWLAVGVAQSGLSGGQSFLLDAWFPLWPLVWQPAIGILMAGALVSGGLSWLDSNSAEK